MSSDWQWATGRQDEYDEYDEVAAAAAADDDDDDNDNDEGGCMRVTYCGKADVNFKWTV